jgi:two-component sensor histidine kinase/CHASE3 domain sensor protein
LLWGHKVVRPSRKSGLWTILAVVLVAIVAASLLLGSSLRSQRATAADITRSFEDTLTLRRTLRLLVDAETGQRGFLLTGKPGFLEPYERARRLIPSQLDRLVERRLVAADGPLMSRSERKLAELSRTVALAQSGRRSQALAIVASEDGKHDMDAIRTEVSTLTRLEQAHIERALQQSEDVTRQTYVGLAVLAAAGVAILWLGVAMLLRAGRLESETARLHEVEQAERRSSLIAKELNHRVKNLFAVILALVQLASRGATTPKEAVHRISERLQALARAHEIALGTNPMDWFDLEALLAAILAPYASGGGELEMSGPAVEIAPSQITPISLIVHELATNALKYGAWSDAGGAVLLTWSRLAPDTDSEQPLLRLAWEERADSPVSKDGAAGFGSRMIKASVAQLDGRFARKRTGRGLSFTIDVPVISKSE